MAFILEVLIIDAGDRTIKVGHNFYGETEAECETYKREHLASCDYFRAAQKDGRLIEELWELDDDEKLPEPSDYDDDQGEEQDEDEFEESFEEQ